jgi:glycosyltransferase involved in cell wall biosynthesis
MDKLPLSVAIISFNEEASIARTIQSVLDIASQIVVVDSRSTDATCLIAEDLGAEVYVENWKGHIRQKNSALDKCREEWVLALDCDEVLTDELRDSVAEAVQSGGYDGYELNRRTFYAGRFLKHSWQPDRKLRLVKMSAKPCWGGYDPHDVLQMEGEKGFLKGDLLHYSYKDIADHFQRLVKYAKTAAESYQQNGKRFRIINLLVNPPAAFIKKYFFRLGFLDGFRGLLVAFSSLMYVFLKYVFLWEAERKSNDS